MTICLRNFFSFGTLAAVLFAAASLTSAQAAQATTPTMDEVNKGGGIFLQQCGFCHGRDAGGGETGPDLTASKLVASDVNGDKIAPVILNGRVDRGMPRFTFSDADIASLVAFIHHQKTAAESQNGGRRGVDVSDLQTGNVEAGKKYFYGPVGKCVSCHNPSGDLNGVATRYQGLELLRQFLNPQGAKASLTVTLPSGQTITGELAYHDEFVVGLRDASGLYHSWKTTRVKYRIDAPADAHAELLAKYSDDDIHNLMAYLQTLR